MLNMTSTTVKLQTSKLDLVFGSDSSSVAITATGDNNGVLFNGNGVINFNSSGNYDLTNYKDSNHSMLANLIHMSSGLESRIKLYNYDYSGSGDAINTIDMYSKSSKNVVEINNKYEGSTYSNRLQLSCTSTYAKIGMYNMVNGIYTSSLEVSDNSFMAYIAENAGVIGITSEKIRLSIIKGTISLDGSILEINCSKVTVQGIAGYTGSKSSNELAVYINGICVR